LPPSSLDPEGRAEAVVEMSADDGARMTIRGGFDMDVGNLAETFWNRPI
jgi:hypothetical protein